MVTRNSCLSAWVAALLLASFATTTSGASFSRYNDAQLAELYESGALGNSPAQQFHSSSVRPPALNVLEHRSASSRRRRSSLRSNILFSKEGGLDEREWYTFVGARGRDAHDPAPYIYDDEGELVWHGRKGNVLNFRKHKYKGQDVLAWYTGSSQCTEEWPGYGNGQWQIYDNTYTLVATVEAQNTTRNMTDPHDFQITKDDTAVIEYWTKAKQNLSDVGGANEGWVWTCIVQEVDIETGELLFEWKIKDHVQIKETGYTLRDGQTGENEDAAFDYAHLNSVKKDDAGNYLIGMRGPSTLYYIDGKSGELLWRLGGKLSDFKVDDNATFFSQHDANIIGKGTDDHFQITLFNNEANQYEQREGEARGMILDVDRTTMKVLSNGNVVVGWGIVPYFSEFLANGTMIHNVQLGPEGSSLHSYRTTKHRWIGKPQTLPSFVLDDVRSDRAHVSWNGATEVASWHVVGGKSRSGLHTIERERRTGFETTLQLPHGFDYFAAVAVDSRGKCLAVSETRQFDDRSSVGATMTCQDVILSDVKRDHRLHAALLLVLAITVAAFKRIRRTPVMLLRQAVTERGAYSPLLTTPPTPSPPAKDTHFAVSLTSSPMQERKFRRL
ncbi:hypothetical protein OIV83_004180 [Microbotryomycetes sp. JL201]|nr:hypothetical protein OIV83_004180 [Microbotryomycetes sp. JL201]